MKKLIISFPVIYLLFHFQVAAQLPKNSLKELHLKGKVKTVVEFAYLTVEKSGKVQLGEIIENPTICYFKENGNLILKEWPTDEYLVADQKPEKKDTFLYDSRGNIIETDTYNLYGRLASKITYKYDSTQRLIEKSAFQSNGSLRERSIYNYTYKYAPSLTLIDELCYGKDGSRNGGNNFQFDNLGNLIQEILSGITNIKNTYNYDDNGNMIEKNRYYATNETKYTYKYEFDKNNNWIKRSEFRNGVVFIIAERTITYY